MNSLAAVLPHLERRCKSQRLVFWHDPQGEYSAELDALDLPEITTLRIANNEYAVKNRVLHDDPEGKFLIYRAGAVPHGTGNWLLDLELAYGVFVADRAALICQDLGLSGDGIDQVVRDHDKFFRAAGRVQRLKVLLVADDDGDRLRAKMCAVLLGQREHSMLELTRTLLIENANRGNEKYDALVEHGLEEFHWSGATKIYRYRASEPTVDDFVLWIFRQAINGFASETPGGLRNIELDFASLRNERRSAGALAALATHASQSLDYASRIADAELSTLVGNDLFEDVERQVIRTLVSAIVKRTMSAREVSETIRVRQSSIWVDSYRELYAALSAASELLSELATARLEIESFDDGLDRYRRDWFRIDQLYRQFHFAARATEYPQVLDAVRAEVDKHYVNGFLYKLGNAWQQQVDSAEQWRSVILGSQTSFFADRVKPVIRKGGRRAVVIISDAMRYEVADELGSRIRQEDRFEAVLDATLGVLPSYTQLGMAALLPHRRIGHSPDGDPVLVDGQRTDGMINRNKVLATADGQAISAKEFLAQSADQRRNWYQQHRVHYVFHDIIDATGDDAKSEHRVFSATEEALAELVKLVRALASANATNIIVTADHGFLYQDVPLGDASYLSAKPQGDGLVATNRRYVLGRGLKEDPAFRKFAPEQLGLSSDLEVQIPKSIHRLKLPGAGSRFVHGGASLQEIVVPVLTINKKRKSDIRPVNVEVLPETDKITTGQLLVKLLQSEPVSEKVQERKLRAGLYVGEMLISNQPELIFDQASDDVRDRYQRVRLLLSQDANEFNNRAVEFRLEAEIPNTTQWRVYQRTQYLLKRSFTSDF